MRFWRYINWYLLIYLPIARVADRHNISQRQYADDTQVYMKFTNTSVATQVNNMQACLTELHASQ